MASRFWVGGTGTWDNATTTNWSATSGGAGGQSVPGSGDTVTFDGSSGGGTVTVNTNFSVISVTMGAFTGTLDFSANNNSPTMQTFSCSGTGTRTLNMGSGTFSLTGNSATIWDTTTTTGLTFNGGTCTINSTYAGSTGTRSITPGSITFPNLKISAGAGAVGLTAATYSDVDFTGFTGGWNATTMTINGNLTTSATMTDAGGGNVITFSGSSPQTFTTNNAALARGITISGASTNLTLVGNYTNSTVGNTRVLTLTQGTFNANGYNVTTGSFSSSNSNTRVLTMGSGTWTLTGNAATIWTTATSTGMTLNPGTSTVNCNYSGATGTRTIIMTATTAVNNLSISAGTDTCVTNTVFCNDLSFSGFSGTWSNSGANVSMTGNFTLGAGMTVTGGTGTTQTFTGTGTQTITSNGVAFNRSLNFNGTGTVVFADTFSENGAQAGRTATLTQGTLNFNNQNVTFQLFASSNSNTRVLNLTNSTITLSGTGTVWNITTGTNLTFNAGNSTIVANDASTSSKTFAFNAMTYNNLRLSGAGTGTFIIGVSTATTTFNNITVDTPPHTVQVFAGKTLIASSLTWSGTSGKLNTFQSTTNGTPWFILDNNPVNLDYISLQDSAAAGAIPFYAGIHSTNVSGNTNWIFTDRPISMAENAIRDQNHIPSLLGSDDGDPTKTVLVYADPTNHALIVDDAATGTNQGGSAAPRDANYVPAIMAVSNVDGVTPVVVYMNANTHELLIKST